MLQFSGPPLTYKFYLIRLLLAGPNLGLTLTALGPAGQAFS